MPKAKVRPPRTPQGESAKVTIANQARQIANLTQRCSDLVTERDGALAQANRAEMELMNSRRELATEHQFRSADLSRLAEAKAEILRLEATLEGYRMHAKDMAGIPVSPTAAPKLGVKSMADMLRR